MQSHSPDCKAIKRPHGSIFQRKKKRENIFLKEAIRYARQFILQTTQLKMLMLMQRNVAANRSYGLPATVPLLALHGPLGRGRERGGERVRERGKVRGRRRCREVWDPLPWILLQTVTLKLNWRSIRLRVCVCVSVNVCVCVSVCMRVPMYQNSRVQSLCRSDLLWGRNIPQQRSRENILFTNI